MQRTAARMQRCARLARFGGVVSRGVAASKGHIFLSVTVAMQKHPQDPARRSMSSVAPSKHLKAQMSTAVDAAAAGNELKFHHVHLYVDHLESLDTYKALEKQLNAFASKNWSPGAERLGFSDLAKSQKIWEDDFGPSGDKNYTPAKRDIIKQVLSSTGWRIMGMYEGPETVSYQLGSTPAGREGMTMAVTAKKQATGAEATYAHFGASNLDQYFASHGGRQGCGVLAFESSDVEAIHRNYSERHPSLVRSAVTLHGDAKGSYCKVFEAYAYYKKDSNKEADLGTVIRFIESSSKQDWFPMPGFAAVPADFPVDAAGVCEAFSDHWVSNVFNREQVLSTFKDVLGFQPKVNFNAGVVGAGEAVIESTVSGNETPARFSDDESFFKSQDQIFLPINNPLSPHGHVYHYLEQVGQGVQHLASRVRDLTAFIDRANKYRQVTGEGLAFLRIPRSYYGYLSEKRFAEKLGSAAEAAKMLDLLADAGISDRFSRVVRLDVTTEEVEKALKGKVAGYDDEVSKLVLQGRYSNMLELLKDRFTETEYLRLIENAILVDIQGRDALLQIFTNPLVFRETGDQSIFLEFIQRVCDPNATDVKPGCGGFGIRNFLTLFLSIEVSNFMDKLEVAEKAGDSAGANVARKAIEIFTNQLNVSNPVLTEMTDAMTAQSDGLAEVDNVREQMAVARTPALEAEENRILAEIKAIEVRKEEIQERLKVIGEEHKNAMKTLMASAA